MKSDKYEYKLPDDIDGFIIECCTLEFSEDVIKDLDEISNGINTNKRIVLKMFNKYEHADFSNGEIVKVFYKNTAFKGTIKSLNDEKILYLTYLEHIDNKE